MVLINTLAWASFKATRAVRDLTKPSDTWGLANSGPQFCNEEEGKGVYPKLHLYNAERPAFNGVRASQAQGGLSTPGQGTCNMHQNLTERIPRASCMSMLFTVDVACRTGGWLFDRTEGCQKKSSKQRQLATASVLERPHALHVQHLTKPD